MSFDPTGLTKVADGVTQGQVFCYESTETAATVIASGFLGDGYGLRVGDLLIIRQFSSAAKTALTAQSLHSITSITEDAIVASAALAGSGSYGVLSGTASPDVNLDTLDGALVGTLYVDTSGDMNSAYAEPFIAVSVATGAAKWQNIGNDVILPVLTSTALTSAGQTLGRLVAPFAGRITAFRAIVLTAATGATDKLVRLVISGVTVTSGSLTFADGDAIGTKYAAKPSTANAVAEGNTITIQTGAQPCATGVFNFYIVLRRMATS